MPDTTSHRHNMPQTQHVTDTTCHRHNMSQTQHATDTTCHRHNMSQTQLTLARFINNLILYDLSHGQLGHSYTQERLHKNLQVTQSHTDSHWHPFFPSTTWLVYHVFEITLCQSPPRAITTTHCGLVALYREDNITHEKTGKRQVIVLEFVELQQLNEKRDF